MSVLRTLMYTLWWDVLIVGALIVAVTLLAVQLCTRGGRSFWWWFVRVASVFLLMGALTLFVAVAVSHSVLDFSEAEVWRHHHTQSK